MLQPKLLGSGLVLHLAYLLITFHVIITWESLNSSIMEKIQVPMYPIRSSHNFLLKIAEQGTVEGHLLPNSTTGHFQLATGEIGNCVN